MVSTGSVSPSLCISAKDIPIVSWESHVALVSETLHWLWFGGSYLFGFSVVWVGFVNLTQLEACGKKKPQVEKIPPSGWPVAESVGHFLGFYWYRGTQASVYNATPGQVPVSCG